MLVWTAISALGALQTYSDNLRTGVESHYGTLLATWFAEYAIPLMVLSAVLSTVLARWPALVERPRNVVPLFAGLVLLFQPTQWLYIAWLRGFLVIGSLADVRQVLMKMLLVGWFTTTATFAAILAIHYWRQAKERELARQRAQNDLLNLRLALEEQRMLALRAQLEPHFLFNALNAISALVRGGDSKVALGGIARLSALLRYALSASVHNTASLADELQFVRDYLDLQRLRYGARLRVRIDGDDDRLHAVECPPLLLQPLIENALRHDLDCHDGPGDIRLCFEHGPDTLLISVSNPVSAQASPNPGAGLGLANTRDRLRLMHPAATLHAAPRGERFVAEVRLPLRETRTGAPLMPVRYLIVDDEEPGRANLRLALAGQPGWELAAECDGTAAARAALAAGDVDVVFLDIQMPAESGLVLAREWSRLREPPLIVFVTAYSSHAIDAFDVHALDYLLKPLDDARLAQAVERGEAMLRYRQREAYGAALRHYVDTDAGGAAGGYVDRVNVRSVGRIEQVLVEDILWIGAAGNYAELHLPARTVLHRITLNRMEALLDPQRYLRVHRGAIVRRDQVARLDTIGDGAYRLTLRCGAEVPVSERYVNQLRAAM